MNKHRWSQDELNYFVQLYKKHECLWNVKNSSYTNKSLRAAAFADIKAKMLEHKNLDGLGIDEIKEKISVLRATYYQHRKRYRYSSISPLERAGKWYKNMEYILKTSKTNIIKDHSDLNAKLFTKTYNSKSMDKEVPANCSTILKLNANSQDNSKLQMDQTINKKYSLVSKVKLQSRIEIMNVLKKLYKEGVAPSYSIMFDILTNIIQNDDACLTRNVESFKYEVTKLGYILKETIDGKNMIVEDAEQRYERYLYLTKIRKIRAKQKKPIVYIDERLINTQLKYEKFHDPKNGLPPESCVLFLAITKVGFLNGLFSNQATEEDFNKWVTDILLGLLKEPCVIIMDNSPIHGTMEDTCSITRYSTKNEMMKWLTVNNIPCSPKLSRPELFELIRKNKRDSKEYKIDRIIKSHGHDVLRLPNNFSELNMSDVLWNAIADGNCSKLLTTLVPHTSLQMLQNKLIDSILPSISKKKWSELEKVLIMKENDIYQIDDAIENILETYIFM